MTTLVTGATGFVGSMVAFVAAGEAMLVLTRPESSGSNLEESNIRGRVS